MGIINSAFTIFLYFFSWWVIPIITLFILKKKWGAWNIEAVLIEKRGENLVKTNDRIRKFVDKATGLTYYKLLKCKDTLPVFNYDWILHTVEQPTNVIERVIKFLRPTAGCAFIFRYGSKQYKPLPLKQSKTNKMSLKEIKDIHGEAIFKWEYGQFDPRWVIGVLNFEVIDWDNMNFIIQEQRASVERRKAKNDWLKQVLLPLGLVAGAIIISIFILKFSADAGKNLSTGTPAPSGGGGSKIVGGIQDVFTPGT